MGNARVGIVMGSDSDLDIMNEAANVLKEFGVEYELMIASAHRTPARTEEFAGGAIDRGLKVIIAGAGMAAHLAGVCASQTTLPIIGVPINAGPLNGFDALLSTVQMPGGVPVASMAIGKAGAKNAGIFAVQILASGDEGLAEKLVQYKKDQAAKVIAKAEKLKS